VGLALLAVLAISAVAAASASATVTGPIWEVNGAKLGTGLEETLTGKAASSYELKGKAFGFIEVAITCKSAANNGSLIGGEPGTDATTIEYTECSSSLCTPTEPIVTKAKSELVYYTASSKTFIGDLFSPKTGTVFTEIKCGSITAKVTGSIVGELLNEAKEPILKSGTTAGKVGYVRFSGANNEKYENHKGESKTAELILEGNPSTLKGTTEVTLTSGDSYRPAE
jgi:hypothetical protein